MARLIPKSEHEKIVMLYKLGLTYGAIGEAYKVRRQDIFHILKHMCKLDMNGRQYLVSLKVRQSKEYIKKCLQDVEFNYSQEQSFIDHYGMSREEFNKLTGDDYKFYKKFSTQRSSAKRRGVAFNLTFQQWLNIWQDSGHMHEGGKFRNNFVMARKHDLGAYELGNVSIITTLDNTSEIAINRALKVISSHSKKTIEQIKEAIYG